MTSWLRRLAAGTALLACGACTRIILVDESDDRVGEVPNEMARIDDGTRVVLIDRYEASIAPGPGVWGSEDQDTDDDGHIADASVAEAHAASHGLLHDDDGEAGITLTTKVARSVAGATPAEASYYQAAAACANAGKRLCTGAEWLVACQNGAAFTTYPYGDAFDGADEPGGDCWTAQLAGGAQLTGSASRCVTSAGVYDMSGNVAEWVDYESPTVAAERGGTVASTGGNATCTSRLDGRPGFSFLNLGFRCCRDP